MILDTSDVVAGRAKGRRHSLGNGEGKGEGQVGYGVQWRDKHGPKGSQHFRGRYESKLSSILHVKAVPEPSRYRAQHRWFFVKFRKITSINYVFSV